MSVKIVYNNNVLVDSDESVQVRLNTNGKRMLDDVIVIETAGVAGPEAGLRVLEYNKYGEPTHVEFVNVTRIPDRFMAGTYFFAINTIDLDGVEVIGDRAFSGEKNDLKLCYFPASVTDIGLEVLDETGCETICISNSSVSISPDAFIGLTGVDIYVTWAENVAANAPWGAKEATVHYNWDGVLPNSTP